MGRDASVLAERSAAHAEVVPADGGGPVERVLAVLVAVGAFALPLVFTIVLDDVFALPKTILMLGLSIPLLGGLILLTRRAGSINLGQVSGATLALAVYLVLTSAATLRSPDPLQSLIGEQLQYQGLLATIGYVVAFLAARSSLGSLRWLMRLLGIAVGSAVVVSLYGLLQQLDADPIWDVLNKGRVFSTLGQANALAAYLVLWLPLALAFSIIGRGIGRAVAILAAAAIAITLALTLSRGGYLGAGFALVVFAACAIRRSSVTRRRVAIGCGLLSGIVVLVAFVPPITRSAERVTDRMLQIADFREGSAASHLDLWAVGVRMAADYPLLGVGPEIYPQLVPAYRDDVLSPERALVMARFRPESPHNVMIAIAVGAGLPALAAYAGIVLLAMRSGWLRLRRAPPIERLLLAALLASVAGHLVTDSFMTAEVTGSWTFFVMLGALCAAANGASMRGFLPGTQSTSGHPELPAGGS